MDYKPLVEDLYVKNSISEDRPIDHYFLSRSLKNIPRCHTLPVENRDSVAEHVTNTLFLADFLNHNGFINPKLTKEQLYELKEILQYHDLGESIVGDIPYHTAKLIKDFEETAKRSIANQFGIEDKYSPMILELSSQIDTLDFVLSMNNACLKASNSFDKRRLEQVYQNGLDILRLKTETAHFKVEYLDFIRMI